MIRSFFHFLHKPDCKSFRIFFIKILQPDFILFFKKNIIQKENVFLLLKSRSRHDQERLDRKATQH